MHFVDEKYDRGPILFALPVPIEPGDTPETLAAKVNRAEHEWQPRVLNYVVHGQVRLVGQEVVYETEELQAPAAAGSVVRQKVKNVKIAGKI